MSNATRPRQPERRTQPQGCAGWLVHAGRLRSGWRVLFYLIAGRALDLVVGLVVGLVLVGVILLRPGQPTQTPAQIANAITAIVSNMFDYPALILGSQALRVVLVLALIRLFRRFIDRRSFRSLGFEFTGGWWLE